MDLIPAQISEDQNQRSLANLIQGCMITILACVWTSIHPNIPGPDDSGWKSTKRRVLTMIYALIAPEFVVIWALRQYFAAQQIANLYNREFRHNPEITVQVPIKGFKLGRHLAQRVKDLFGGSQDHPPRKLSNNPRWSRTHGFFIQMGGFLLYDPSGSPLRALDYDTIAQLLRQRAISSSDISITEREIYDRSKGDAVSKGIVVLQTMWFTVQALCRIHAGLPLTGIEVLTLAFAVLNGAIYAIWWKKPQGVEVSVPVRMQIPTREVGTNMDDSVNQEEEIIAPSCSERGFKITTTESWSPKAVQYTRMRGELNNNTLKPLCALLPMVSVICNSSLLPLHKMALSEQISTHDVRVPMFYAHPKWRENTSNVVFAGPIIGVVFGAVHLLAWSSTFPTFSEQILW